VDAVAALVVPATRHSETTDIHTRLQKLALGVEESRRYWEHVCTLPSTRSPTSTDRALVAFEQRWFGSKSLERVRFLLSNLTERYDSFPEALEVLQRWRMMDAQTRQVICHFHLQLSDPLYRLFTSGFLVERRASPHARIDRPIVLRWLRTEFPDKWSESTLVQFASKLLSATSEAGLVSPKRDPRSLLLPKVSDIALTYMLHLLRTIRFKGTLTNNPYLGSLGLVDGALDQRLRALSAITFRRMGALTELEWHHPTLTAWAEATL
jgi:hypothetical protein